MTRPKRNQRPRVKTQILNAMLDGALHAKAIRAATGLSSLQVNGTLQALRKLGVIEVAEHHAVYTGARPGHIWRVKGRTNG